MRVTYLILKVLMDSREVLALELATVEVQRRRKTWWGRFQNSAGRAWEMRCDELAQDLLALKIRVTRVRGKQVTIA